MQEKISSFSYNKLKFFGIVCIIVTAVTIPLIIPHLAHPSMVYHIILHVASLAIAIFLCFVSVTAYYRGGRTRLLFMALGFIALAILEALLLLSATGNSSGRFKITWSTIPNSFDSSADMKWSRSKVFSMVSKSWPVCRT